MKILIPVVAGVFVIVQSGCNGSSNSTPNPATPAAPGVVGASPSPSPTSSAVWSQISERTMCTGAADECVGAYGFAVFSNGSYQVGPAQTGLYILGSLAHGEIDVINQDALSVAGNDLTTTYTCAGTSSSNGTGDNVSILLAGQSLGDVIYREFLIGEGSDCYLGNANDAFQLHEDMNHLMTEYYPIPFPSPTTSPTSSPSPSPSPSTPASGTAVENGTWGGDGIAADVESTGASFDFDCAQGQTGGPIVETADGSFSEPGTFSDESGPIIQNDPREYAATYSGKVTGNQMSLTVQYQDYLGKTVTLPFTLTYGQTGNINPICPLY